MVDVTNKSQAWGGTGGVEQPSWEYREEDYQKQVGYR